MARRWKSATTAGKCPRARIPVPASARDTRGQLHVSWFTLGRSEKEAGIYYSVSRDGGKSFSPRQLVARPTPRRKCSTTTSWSVTTTRFIWPGAISTPAKVHRFICARLRPMAVSGARSSNQQQQGQRQPPDLALRNNQLHIAWTEIDSETHEWFLGARRWDNEDFNARRKWSFQPTDRELCLGGRVASDFPLGATCSSQSAKRGARLGAAAVPFD